MKFPKKFIELKSSILLKRDAFFILLITCLFLITGFSGEAKSQSLLQKVKIENLQLQSSISIMMNNVHDGSRSISEGLTKKIEQRNFKFQFSQSIFFDEYFVKYDSTIIKDTMIKRSSTDLEKKKNVKFEMKKSPWKAVLFSAILPGLGQVYNESYWKLSIVAVVGGSLGYYFFYNNSKYIDYRELYENSQTSENPNGDERYKRLRESYRDARDQNLLYFMIFYLVNLADAYVDAHLYDFNVNKNIRFGLFQKGSLASIKFNF